MNERPWRILANSTRERALRREIGQEVKTLLASIIPADEWYRAKEDDATAFEDEAGRDVEILPTIETQAAKEARRQDHHRTRRMRRSGH